MFFGDRNPWRICVTERRYRLTRRTQALKETNRFTWLVPQIHAHTQGGHELSFLGSPGETSERFITRGDFRKVHHQGRLPKGPSPGVISDRFITRGDF